MSALLKRRKPAKIVVFETVNSNRWAVKLNIYNKEHSFSLKIIKLKTQR